jgi:hypothetical protein
MPYDFDSDVITLESFITLATGPMLPPGSRKWLLIYPNLKNTFLIITVVNFL